MYHDILFAIQGIAFARELMTIPATVSLLSSASRAAVLLGLCALFLVPPSAQAEEPGAATSPDGKIHVQMLSLKRTEGETLTLHFQITNNGNDDYSMTIDNMRLIDIAGRRVYSPGLHSPSCRTPVGQQLTCYAVFGAPPASTRTMAVQFYERLDLITGVPISE